MYMPSSVASGAAHRPPRAHSARTRPYRTPSSLIAASSRSQQSRIVRRDISEATLRPALAATLPALRGGEQPATSLLADRRLYPRTHTAHSRSGVETRRAGTKAATGASADAHHRTHLRLPPLKESHVKVRPLPKPPAKPRSTAGSRQADASETADMCSTPSPTIPSPSSSAAPDVAVETMTSPADHVNARTAEAQCEQAGGGAEGHSAVEPDVLPPAQVLPSHPAHSVLRRIEAALRNFKSDREPGAHGAAARAVFVPQSPSACDLAELCTLVANANAVRSSVMAMPLGETYAHYQDALRYMATDVVEETGFDPFAGDPVLRRVLSGLVRSNIAAEQRQSFSCPPSETQRSFILALGELDGLLATMVLYNLAALFFSECQMEDATEALARCVELAQACLTVPAPLPAATEATACSSPSFQRACAVHRAFIAFHATHLVLCHLLIASFASWCGEEDVVEQYHCQLAAGCATTYLPDSHPLRARCLKRMKAAQARVHRRVTDSAPVGARASAAMEERPPPQPLLFFGEILPIFDRDESARQYDLNVADGRATLAEEEEEEDAYWWLQEAPSSTWMSSATAAQHKTRLWLTRPVEVSELLFFSTQVARSPELHAYVVHAKRALVPIPASHAHTSPTTTTTTSVTGTHSEMPMATADDSLEASLRQFSSRIAGSPSGVQVPPLHTPTAPRGEVGVHVVSPPVVTTLPPAVFKRYRKLKAFTAKAVDGTQPPPPNGATTNSHNANNSTNSGNESTSAAVVDRQGDAEGDGNTSHSRPLHHMDRELLRYSRVVPGTGADADGADQAEALISPRVRAARCIQRAIRCHQARCRRRDRARAVAAERQRQIDDTNSKAEAFQQHVHRARVEDAAARVLQRSLRRWMTLEKARDRAEKLAWLRRRGAARSFARHRHAQLERRKLWQFLEPYVTTLQRWWRGHLVLRQQLLPARQAAIQNYLAAQESAHAEVMSTIPWHAAQAARTINAVLRGARDRAWLAQQHARLERAKVILRRWISRSRARHIRETQAAARFVSWQQQRVAELEMDAAAVIEAAVRAWLARRRYLRRPTPEQAAQRIQSQWRRHYHRQRRAVAYKDTQAHQLRHYAATLIQATWRMYRTRARVAAQLQYMLWDRHVYALRIQRAWRAWHARQVVRRECAYVAHRKVQRQHTEQRYCAAARLQATVRMFLTRCWCAAQGLPLWPVQVRPANSSLLLADAGADAAPRDVYGSDRESRMEEDEKRAEEDAKWDQGEDEDDEGARVPSQGSTSSVSVHSRSSATTAPPPPRTGSPTCEPQFVTGDHAIGDAADHTRAHDDTGDAETEAPRTSGRSAPSLGESDGALSGNSHSQSIIAHVTRDSSSVVVETAERTHAATVIQKHWRGYAVRKKYEYYYEIYYEEVEVTDDEDEDDEAA